MNSIYIQQEEPALVNLPSHNKHEITVTVDSGKFTFTPAVTEFIMGHSYIFDNTGVAAAHPLRFTESSTHPGMDS